MPHWCTSSVQLVFFFNLNKRLREKHIHLYLNELRGNKATRPTDYTIEIGWVSTETQKCEVFQHLDLAHDLEV